MSVRARLRIAVLAHIRHPIGLPFMGGMEAHSFYLVEGLRRRGHEVTLFAAGDSETEGPLYPLVAEHYDRAFPWHDFHGTDVLNDHLDMAYFRALEPLRAGEFDVIHNNSLHRFPPRMARRDRMPMVSSMHVPPFDALARAIRASLSPWSQATVCSAQQRSVWWPGALIPETLHVVPNGIDTDAWPYVSRGDGSAVWAGRITPTKAPHIAAKAAQIAGIPLTIFGVVEHRDYFEHDVKPLLVGPIRYGGHLPSAALAVELGRASVALFTPHWDEPFGLAAIEAMSCGLPVAATEIGAVREVIGPAGAYAPPSDPVALAASLLRALDIPRRVPRERVEQYFSLNAMLDAYEALYRQVIAQKRAPAMPVTFPAIELPDRDSGPVLRQNRPVTQPA